MCCQWKVKTRICLSTYAVFFNIMTYKVGFTLLGRMYLYMRQVMWYVHVMIYYIYYVISWKNCSRKTLSCDYQQSMCGIVSIYFTLITHAKGNPLHHWDWVLNSRHPQAWSQFNIQYVSWWILSKIRYVQCISNFIAIEYCTPGFICIYIAASPFTV
jgi:hypothetical protein